MFLLFTPCFFGDDIDSADWLDWSYWSDNSESSGCLCAQAMHPDKDCAQLVFAIFFRTTASHFIFFRTFAHIIQ